MEFVVKNVISESEIPKSLGGRRNNYEPIFEKFNRISEGKTLVIEIDKLNRSKGIKTAMDKQFGKSKHKLETRKNKESGVVTVYITRKF